MFTAPLTSAAESRRADLRARLTDIAEATIAKHGLKALRARDLATQAGCALGAIYTVFPALDDLVLLVNARTFARLGRAIAAELADAPADATAQLIAMAQAYHAFAAANRPAWAAMFAIERPPGTDAPDWYRAEMDQLLTWIEAPLVTLMPDLSSPDRALMARTLFSAVHGIVSLGLDDAAAGLPRDQIDRMMGLLLSQIRQHPVS
jgi:AcrR family transcriptional regulator